MQFEILKIQEYRQLKEAAAEWFHKKWGIPIEAYRQSMQACIEHKSAVPQWYIARDGQTIIGGLGVIENDFHERKDLAPNVCALYVENKYRCHGIAGELLSYVCKDMADKGVNILYLVTDHTSFYERYGWSFLCMVRCAGESDMTRMYIHKS